MRAAWRKILNNRGESISEILVASGIAALALTLLAGMITAAGRMITDSHKAYEEYLDTTNSFVSANAANNADEISVLIKFDSDTTIDLPGNNSVNLQKGEDIFMYSSISENAAAEENP